MAKRVDCLIIGGGPAGLTAAIYAARFRLSVQVLDAGKSRAELIPCTRNHAGFPSGISGSELVARMRQQAVEYGACIERGVVSRLDHRDDLFLAETAEELFVASGVILATGVTNLRPVMDDDLHDAAVKAGRLRYCPVCDGFEVTDQNIAVIGTGAHGAKEALFLRSYSQRVTLISPGPVHELEDGARAKLNDAGVSLLAGPVAGFTLSASGLSFLCGRDHKSFDAVYPALGSVIHSDLAVSVGADTSDVGCIIVDEHQRTSLPMLYAAGDVVIGLDQISHAMGEAGVAATTLRNDLNGRSPLLR